MIGQLFSTSRQRGHSARCWRSLSASLAGSSPASSCSRVFVRHRPCHGSCTSLTGAGGGGVRRFNLRLQLLVNESSFVLQF